MPRPPLVAATAFLGAALALGACGGTTKTFPQTQTASSQPLTAATQPTAPTPLLTRAQLIARANLICKRVTAKRHSVKIASAEDYERLVPALATYELAAAAQMRSLTPPTSMAHTWKRIVDDFQTIGEVTGHFRHYYEASNDSVAHGEDLLLGRATNELLVLTGHNGLHACSLS